MRKLTLAAAAVVVVASARPVLAVEPYVGAQYMQSKSSCQGFRDGVAPLGLTATCDETDGGFRVHGGLNLGSTLGLEVGYQDAGEARADAFSRGVYALTLTSPLTAWDAVVTVRKELGRNARVVGRAGVARWDYEVKASAGTFGAKNDGTTPTFGAGVEYRWITLGYDAILKVGQGNLLAPTAPDIKQTVHRVSVGLKYTFSH